MMVVVCPVPIPLLGKYSKWLYCARGPALDADNLEVLNALLARVHALAKSNHAVICKMEPNVLEGEDELWREKLQACGFQANPNTICGRRSWVLDLRPSEQELLAGFRKAWRYNIRLAEREGVEVREVKTDEDFEAYYRLLVITSQRDGFVVDTLSHQKEFYRRYASTGDGVLYLAIYQGKPIAARMVIRFGETCLDMFGASSNEDRGFPKTHIVQYRCIQWAKSKGCSIFDFRTIPDTLAGDEEMYGVYHYKKGFGGFSRLHMPTYDYVYQPLLYHLWKTLVEQKHALRRRKYEKKQPAKSMKSETVLPGAKLKEA
jgi:lipid II:glycine glycyltransferase (peptidoglycan interpeptide bridge formation enzyme)